jgi:hypothetical protein
VYCCSEYINFVSSHLLHVWPNFHGVNPRPARCHDQLRGIHWASMKEPCAHPVYISVSGDLEPLGILFSGSGSTSGWSGTENPKTFQYRGDLCFFSDATNRVGTEITQSRPLHFSTSYSSRLSEGRLVLISQSNIPRGLG